MPLLKVILAYLLLGRKNGKSFRYYVSLTKVNPTSTLLSVALFITITLLVHTQLQLQNARVQKDQSSYHAPPNVEKQPCIPDPFTYIIPAGLPAGPQPETKANETKAINVRRHARDRLKRITSEEGQ